MVLGRRDVIPQDLACSLSPEWGVHHHMKGGRGEAPTMSQRVPTSKELLPKCSPVGSSKDVNFLLCQNRKKEGKTG